MPAALGAVPLAALALVSPHRGPPPPKPGELVVSFLDVGQGDATLLQRDGASLLVDTGPPGGPILRRLADAGVERLDVLLITHAEADHEGMALEVIRALPPAPRARRRRGLADRGPARAARRPACALSPPTPARR